MSAYQATSPVLYPRRTPLSRIVIRVFAVVSVVGVVVYGHQAGWFKPAEEKVKDAVAAFMPAASQAFGKLSAFFTGKTPADSEAAKTAAASMASAAPVDAIAAPVVNPAATPAPALEEAIFSARSAYASGDINSAILAYRAAIGTHPDSIDLRGELGNVYLMLGMVEEATQSFYETAVKAIEQNNVEVAEDLLPAVIEGNPLLANDINDRLFDAFVRESESRHF